MRTSRSRRSRSPSRTRLFVLQPALHTAAGPARCQFQNSPDPGSKRRDATHSRSAAHRQPLGHHLPGLYRRPPHRSDKLITTSGAPQTGTKPRKSGRSSIWQSDEFRRDRHSSHNLLYGAASTSAPERHWPNSSYASSGETMGPNLTHRPRRRNLSSRPIPGVGVPHSISCSIEGPAALTPVCLTRPSPDAPATTERRVSRDATGCP